MSLTFLNWHRNHHQAIGRFEIGLSLPATAPFDTLRAHECDQILNRAIRRGTKRRSGFHDVQPSPGQRLAQDGEVALGHVSSILGKLNLRSRTEAAAFAATYQAAGDQGGNQVAVRH